mgnify:CR=1 FL=1
MNYTNSRFWHCYCVFPTKNLELSCAALHLCNWEDPSVKEDRHLYQIIYPDPSWKSTMIIIMIRNVLNAMKKKINLLSLFLSLLTSKHLYSLSEVCSSDRFSAEVREQLDDLAEWEDIYPFVYPVVRRLPLRHHPFLFPNRHSVRNLILVWFADIRSVARRAAEHCTKVCRLGSLCSDR